jgi:hypothetical protein
MGRSFANQAPNKESHPIHPIQELPGSALTYDKTTGTLTFSGYSVNASTINLTAGPLGLFKNQGIEWTSGPPGSGNRLSLYNDVATNTLSIYKGNTGVHGALLLDIDALIGGKTLTFRDLSGTVSLLEADQTWTGNNTFSKGTAATTTVNIGELGDVTSHACFNTKNTDGQDVSFYIVGTSIVVEANVCQ